MPVPDQDYGVLTWKKDTQTAFLKLIFIKQMHKLKLQREVTLKIMLSLKV